MAYDLVLRNVRYLDVFTCTFVEDDIGSNHRVATFLSWPSLVAASRDDLAGAPAGRRQMSSAYVGPRSRRLEIIEDGSQPAHCPCLIS